MLPELFSLRRRSLSERLADALIRMFLALPDYRDENAAEFVTSAVPLVRGTQRALGALIAAQQAQLASEQIGRTVAPPPLPDLVSVDLRGTDPRAVYARPFATVHAHVGETGDMTEAVERGVTRLRETAEGDLQLTHAHATRASVTALRALYWRRTLVGEANCALCVLASTMKYRREDLNPIHHACNCEVVAVYDAANDPVPDEAALIEAAHSAARELTGASDAGGRKVDYRRIRTTITHEHGELGTLLRNPSHHFTGEREALSA